MHTVRTALAPLLLGLGLLVAAPAQAATQAPTPPSSQPASTVSWGVRASDQDGAARDNYRYTLDPGGTRSDTLVVTNHGQQTLDLDVYAADGYTNSTGQLDVRPRTQQPEQVGAWLVPTTTHVTLEPGASTDVPFTLTVPPAATPGDYLGAIVTSRTADPGTGVAVETRSGVRVGLRVTGDLAPRLAVTDARLAYHPTLNPFGAGSATLTYTVRNEGNVRLAANQNAQVTGPFGLLAADAGAIAAVPDLLPGESWQVQVPVDRVVPAFRVHMDGVLVPLLPDGFDDAPAVAPVRFGTSVWAVPWSTLALLALMALLVVLRLRRRGVRRRREDARVQRAVDQALADAGATIGGAGGHDTAPQQL